MHSTDSSRRKHRYLIHLPSLRSALDSVGSLSMAPNPEFQAKTSSIPITVPCQDLSLPCNYTAKPSSHLNFPLGCMTPSVYLFLGDKTQSSLQVANFVLVLYPTTTAKLVFIHQLL